MTRRFAPLAAGGLLLGVLAACIGDDPDATGPLAPEGGVPTADGGPQARGDADTSTPRADAGPDAPETASSARIFATSGKYQGNLGGLSGADAKCADAAATRRYPGTYRAWLSSSSTNAIERIQGNGPWVRFDDRTVFANRDALRGVPLEAVMLDETGQAVAASSNVWTGTTAGGIKTSATCSDWTAVDGAGTFGLAAESDARWTDSQTGPEPCNDFVRLLCLRAD